LSANNPRWQFGGSIPPVGLNSIPEDRRVTR